MRKRLPLVIFPLLLLLIVIFVKSTKAATSASCHQSAYGSGANAGCAVKVYRTSALSVRMDTSRLRSNLVVSLVCGGAARAMTFGGRRHYKWRVDATHNVNDYEFLHQASCKISARGKIRGTGSLRVAITATGS